MTISSDNLLLSVEECPLALVVRYRTLPHALPLRTSSGQDVLPRGASGLVESRNLFVPFRVPVPVLRPLGEPDPKRAGPWGYSCSGVSSEPSSLSFPSAAGPISRSQMAA